MAEPAARPEALLVRRSMPWNAGLMFVAFQAQLRRMAGLEGGIVDARFRFTRRWRTAGARRSKLGS